MVRWRRRVAAAFVGVSVTAVIGAYSPFENTASQSSLQAEASQAAATIASDASSIRNVAVERVALTGEITKESQAIATLQRQLSVVTTHLETERQLLVKLAVDTFTDSSSSAGVLSALQDNQGTLEAQTEFQNVAGGYVTQAINAYRATLATQAQLTAEAETQRNSLQSQSATLVSDENSLSRDESSEQATLGSLNTQLQQLVQAQLAAQLAQKQAAAKAAAAQQAAETVANQAVQGAPSFQGLVLVVQSGQSGSQWGGTPAPPSAAAFAALRNCESGGDYSTNTGNGYYGAYQFSLSTWHGIGETGYPWQASPAVQDQAALTEQRDAGWGAWPECAAELGFG